MRAAPNVRQFVIKKRQGFTLIELLVVLAVASLLLGLVTPSLARWYERVEAINQQENIVAQLEMLGYQAYSSGRSIVLQGQVARLSVGDKPVLEIPDGWKLEAERPIEYGFNGICGGGNLTLMSPDGDSLRLTLAPPLCRVVRAS